jgi:hypothetical protein
MESEVKVWLDKELQIIRQKLVGPIRESQAKYIVEQTQVCVDTLEDPLHVRVLVDACKLGTGDAATRKIMSEAQKRSNLRKVAMWGIKSPVIRTINMLINRATSSHKIEMFKSEQDAIDWLLKKEAG